jgi:hypothetical protein
MSYITGAASLVEPGLDVVFDYKICRSSGNCYLAEMPARTHRNPTLKNQASTLTYRTSRSRRRSICNSCKKVRKCCQYVLQKSNPLENRATKAKKRAVVKAVKRILWKDCVWR